MATVKSKFSVRENHPQQLSVFYSTSKIDLVIPPIVGSGQQQYLRPAY
jgi:hypothetical protein